MNHLQFALSKYPDEIVPELVSFDGVHEQPPEHVTVATQQLPVTHAIHGPPLGPLKPVLQTHTLTLELLAGADELPGHAAQLALSATEYLPTPQSIQLLKLVAPAAEYWPAAHNVHVDGPPAPENVPTAQVWHAVAPAAPEYFPVSHHAQIVLPNVAPYDPAAQLVHALVCAPRENVSTPQSLHAVVPATAYWPVQQSEHVVAPAAAYCPTVHAAQYAGVVLVFAPQAELYIHSQHFGHAPWLTHKFHFLWPNT
jgi:hypothetical protein